VSEADESDHSPIIWPDDVPPKADWQLARTHLVRTSCLMLSLRG